MNQQTSKINLLGTYYVAEVGAEEWYAFVNQHQAVVFPDEQSVALDGFLSEEERTKLGALKENLSKSLALYFLLYENERPIGWHFGFQRSELDYFMANTGLLPAYRNRGIYSAFLHYAIDRIGKEGFQFITSLHRANNNAVLIPKLKKGFLIQAFGFLIQPMLLETNYGPHIQLVYPLRTVYRKLFDAQLGTEALNDEVRQLLPP